MKNLIRLGTAISALALLTASPQPVIFCSKSSDFNYYEN